MHTISVFMLMALCGFTHDIESAKHACFDKGMVCLEQKKLISAEYAKSADPVWECVNEIKK